MKKSFSLSILVLMLVFNFSACGGGGGGGGSASYSIGGTMSGLSGTVVLQNNGADDLTLTADGVFTFATQVADGGAYSVTVLTQPAGQTCTASSNTGTIAGADVTNVSVVCSMNAYSVGGTVNGLAGSGLVLRNNGGDDLAVPANSASFTFAAKVADGAGYLVTVKTQPTGPSQICTANSNTGTISGANVTNVSVVCSTNSYTVGGTISNLTGTGLVLRNNGTDDLAVPAGGTSFTFATKVADGAGYAVTVKTHPFGQGCSVSNGNGAMGGSNVTNVSIGCATAAFGARYSAAPKWNDYVKASDTSTACVGTETGGYAACIHGGERKALQVPGKSSCAGLTASDTLSAFDWSCDGSTNPVQMVTTGLKRGKNLSDLLDFTAPGWKQNSVTVYDGATPYLTTSPTVWWTNTVTVDNDGGNLNAAGTIYVVTSTMTGTYAFGASKVALVVKPGTTITGPAAGADSPVIFADGSSGGAKDFLWFEGNVDATGDDMGIYLNSVRFSVLSGIAVDNANTGWARSGVLLSSSSNNMLAGVAASNSGYRGVNLSSSLNNTLFGVTAANNGDSGVYLSSSSNNTLFGVTASNNGYAGVSLFSSSNNMLTGVAASNNADNGVYLNSSSNNNTLTGVAASNNANKGIYLNSSSNNNTLTGVAASNNAGGGVSLNSSSNNYFTGPLKVGNNGLYDCYVNLGTNPGLDDDADPSDVETDATHSGLCVQEGAAYGGLSDFGTAVTGVSLASSFMGKTYIDSINASDTTNPVDYTTIDPTTFDWLNFENAFRGWGKDGDFGNSNSRGQWTSGNGAIWDWSLASGDSVIRNALSLPTGADALTHTWSDLTTTTFLRNAVEISGDGIGNDNTLCESNETCLYTPNIGSYQGHGNFVSAGTIGTGGTIENVTLMMYETNGR